MPKFSGSCLCQSIKFEAEGVVHGFYLCHCSRCRKATGSAHASNIFIHATSLVWLSGENSVVHYSVPGTRFEKAFCPLCSAALPKLSQGGYALIPAGSLDGDIGLKPFAHISCDSRALWDDGFENIPRIEGLPG